MFRTGNLYRRLHKPLMLQKLIHTLRQLTVNSVFLGCHNTFLDSGLTPPVSCRCLLLLVPTSSMGTQTLPRRLCGPIFPRWPAHGIENVLIITNNHCPAILRVRRENFWQPTNQANYRHSHHQATMQMVTNRQQNSEASEMFRRHYPKAMIHSQRH